ncbi:MAG: amidohydrolase family protein [Protaetiibacter sp.]
MSGILDAHTHLAPELDPATQDVPVVPALLHDPEALAGHLRRLGLDGAIVSVPPPFFRTGQLPAATREWVTAVNDGLLRRVAAHPTLHPLAYLPLDDPLLALAEWESRRSDPLWVGAAGSAGGGALSLADTRFDPLWQMLSADDAPLLLHPGESPDERLDEFYLANLLGNPMETAIAAGQLVFGGVLARFPRLKVLLVHCGGVVPAVAGRWERGHVTARPGLDPSLERPSAALRRLHSDSLGHDVGMLGLAAEVFGHDHVVLGSDWPFPMGDDDPRSSVAALTDDLRHAVEGGAARLFQTRLAARTHRRA